MMKVKSCLNFCASSTGTCCSRNSKISSRLRNCFSVEQPNLSIKTLSEPKNRPLRLVHDFCVLLHEILIREDNFTLHDVVDFTENSDALEEDEKEHQCSRYSTFPLTVAGITCTNKINPKMCRLIASKTGSIETSLQLPIGTEAER